MGLRDATPVRAILAGGAIDPVAKVLLSLDGKFRVPSLDEVLLMNARQSRLKFVIETAINGFATVADR
jgi:hypothetical protein